MKITVNSPPLWSTQLSGCFHRSNYSNQSLFLTGPRPMFSDGHRILILWPHPTCLVWANGQGSTSRGVCKHIFRVKSSNCHLVFIESTSEPGLPDISGKIHPSVSEKLPKNHGLIGGAGISSVFYCFQTHCAPLMMWDLFLPLSTKD